MKRIVLLLTIISHFSFGQNNSAQYKSADKKTTQYTGVVPKAPVWSATDSMNTKSPIYKFETGRVKFKNLATSTDTATYNKVLVLSGDSLRQMSRSYFGGGGGSATIDTTKVGRIEQGRGTAPIFMYFNGVAWVRNDTSYVPKNTNILNVNNFFSVGLSGYDNALSMFRNNNTSLVSKNITPLGGQSNVIVSSLDSGYIQLGIVPSNVSYSRLFSIKGTNYTYPTKSFEFSSGLAHYNGDYRAYMTDDLIIPDIGKVKQLISDSLGGGGSATIDTTKVGRIEQGRGTAPIFMYFNGVAWVRNDTSYAPKSALLAYIPLAGSPNISGSLYFNNSGQYIGRSGLSTIRFNDTQIYANVEDANNQAYVTPSVNGINTNVTLFAADKNDVTKNRGIDFKTGGNININGDIAKYTGLTNAQIATKLNAEPFGLITKHLADSLYAGGGTLTSVYSANSDILVDSSITGKRKLTLNKTLTSGYINIGDATNTAFPRAISGDATISNLGALLFSNVNSNVGTFGGATQSTTQTVNAKGLITSISNVTITPAVGSITGLGTGVASWLATPSSANLSTAITDETGTGVAVFGTSPTFTTNITTPLIVGGTSTTSGITYKTTTGVGTTGADHIFKVGNNGATTAMTITNSALVGIGVTSPLSQLHLRGSVGTSSPAIGNGSLYLQDAGGSANNGGAVLFGAAQGYFGGIKGLLTNGSNNTLGDIAFYTRVISTNANLTEAVRIRETGSVGIGVNNSTEKLEVAGAAMIGTGSVNGNLTKLYIKNTSGKTWAISSGTNLRSENELGFYNWTDDQGVAKMVIGVGGNVTIGNTSSLTNASKLHVEGGIYVGFLGVSNNTAPSQGILVQGNIGCGNLTSVTTGRFQAGAGTASIAGLQLTNQTAYTGGIAGSISLENTNDLTVVGNILAKRGTTANIGTSDNQALQLVTNNTSRLSIGTSGIVTLTAALVGIASQDIFNTTSTTVNAFGAATAGTLFGTSTASVTYGIGNNATASGNTKAINIGINGASGSTTNVVVGSSDSGATSTLTVNGTIKSTGYTVATLPTGSVGMRAYVTDALAPSYSATVVGGGAVIVSVFHNGTTWICN